MPTRTDTLPPHERRAAFTSISMGIDGTCWAVDATGAALRQTADGTFVPEGDRRMKKIAVASKDLVWGLDENLNAVRLMPGSRWEEFTFPGLTGGLTFPDSVYRPLVEIAIAPSGYSCALQRGDDGQLMRPMFSRDRGFWDSMLGGGAQWKLAFQPYVRIAISDWGAPRLICVCALDRSGAVSKNDGTSGFQPLPALTDEAGQPLPAISLALGNDGFVWVVGSNKMVYALPPNGTNWHATGWGPLAQIAGADSYHLVGLTPDETDQDGDVRNDVWISTAGPPGVPLRIAPPPPPPVAAFASPAVPVTNGAQSAPALTAYNRKLYVAYQGGEGAGGSAGNWHQLSVRAATSHAFSQSGFTAMRTFGGIRMGSAPALAAMGSVLYGAFQADDSRKIPFVSKTYDGENWLPGLQLSPIPLRFPGGTRDVGLNIPMGGAPALVEFGGRLYCAFQEDGQHRLIVISSGDGNSWTTFVPSDPGAGFVAVGVAGILIGSAPALAVFNGRLYCAFQANDPNHTLFVTSSSDGDNWQSPANLIPGIAIGDAPGLAVLDGRLYCAYQANDGSRVLCVTTSTDGVRWEPPTRYENMKPAGAVTLCAIDRNLFVGFNGIADACSYVSIASV